MGYKINNLKSQKGVAALLTIVIIAVATLIMAFNSSLLGLGELELGYTSQRGGEALDVAEGCLEETLRRIKLDTSYSGDTLSLGNGSCIINVDASGNDRIVTATSTVDEYHKKVQVNLTLSGSQITINSWQEKSD